jgi:hypothetical protein
MVDVVNYELPLGILRALAHRFGVRRDLKGVFDYRRRIIAVVVPVMTLLTIITAGVLKTSRHSCDACGVL